MFCVAKGMGPEHSEWLRDSDLTNAAELVQDYLDTLEPQDRPAARVGRPNPPTASESQVIPTVLLTLRCLPREPDLASREQMSMLLRKALMLLDSCASGVCPLCMHVLLAECK